MYLQVNSNVRTITSVQTFSTASDIKYVGCFDWTHFGKIIDRPLRKDVGIFIRRYETRNDEIVWKAKSWSARGKPWSA